MGEVPGLVADIGRCRDLITLGVRVKFAVWEEFTGR
jgi:hypothetical protein